MSPSLQNLVLVFLGGGLGALLRHGMNGLALAWWGTGFPWGTLFVNVSGSLLMGAVVELAAQKAGLPPQVRLFVATGLLGGYTTFSTFSLDAGVLLTRGEALAALAYAAASVVLGVAAFFAGMWAVRALAGQ